MTFLKLESRWHCPAAGRCRSVPGRQICRAEPPKGSPLQPPITPQGRASATQTEADRFLSCQNERSTFRSAPIESPRPETKPIKTANSLLTVCLTRGDKRNWHKNWLVIGDEGECGDPIFIDKAAPGYPVYTAWHCQGRWDPKPIAISLNGLREALAAVAKAATHRENPVALEQNPISVEERKAVLAEIQQHNPGIDLFFWALMMGDDLEQR